VLVFAIPAAEQSAVCMNPFHERWQSVTSVIEPAGGRVERAVATPLRGQRWTADKGDGVLRRRCGFAAVQGLEQAFLPVAG